MKQIEAMYAWNANGDIKVGVWPDRTGWSDDFELSGGACYAVTHRRDVVENALQLFIDFHTITVGDNVDPQKAHDEFLKIDEYRDRISPDIRQSKA